MELKTKVNAVDNSQQITVEREFDLPVESLFSAYIEPEFVEQWMGTKVVKLDCQNQGGYIFETTDPKGNVHRFSGAIHSIQNNGNITRTFEMENTPFPPQLEFLEFEKITENTSKLTMHIIYKSAAFRDQMLQMPFAQGINFAHNRLEKMFNV